RDAIMAAKVAFDVAGHYSRPDLFQLVVNRGSTERVKFRNNNITGDAVQLGEPVASDDHSRGEGSDYE
ncbi:MAG: hypothetical protein JRF55_12375, partial [Deltaproteobacteria bacterium]|nr:hypothetical protein [Deltaproteobacteria bacterium]